MDMLYLYTRTPPQLQSYQIKCKQHLSFENIFIFIKALQLLKMKKIDSLHVPCQIIHEVETRM